MDKKRRLAVYGMVTLAIREVFDDEQADVKRVIRLALQYGKSIKITRKEIIEVLNMSVIDVVMKR